MALELFRNKKSQTIIVALMVGVMIFILAAVLTGPLKDETVKIRNNTYLNCSEPTTSKVNIATCTIIDMGFFYFISVCMAISIAYVSGKKNITGILTAIMVFVVIVSLILPLKDFIILARDSTHLDCTNASISIGARLTCLFVDLWLFLFVVTVIAAGVTYIFLKKTVKTKE